MTDKEILDLFWDREPSAITQAANQYGGYCYTIAYGILNNKEDTEECLNDTWHRAWNAIPPQRPSKLSLFFGKITRNLAFDRYKASKTHKRGGQEFAIALHELDESVPSSNSIDTAIEECELVRHINSFLHSLPERECNIFLLRYWYNRSLSEIGTHLSMKENNIKASLFRSRKKLRSYLESEGVHL